MVEAVRRIARSRPAAPRLVAAALLTLGLAACQASDAGQMGSASLNRPTVAAPPDATKPMAPPVPAAQATFRFDQILGVPTNRQDKLATEIARYARGRNLTLVRRGDPSASYRVLGFLSAVGGDAGTSVTYVWDIVDANNNRLHRITGVEAGGTADADPWTGVDDSALTAVAARTVEQIYAWLNQVPAGTAPPSPEAAAPLAGQAI